MAETRNERVERLMLMLQGEPMRWSQGSLDYARKLCEHAVDLRKLEPKETGGWYTLSPGGAAEVRALVAGAVERGHTRHEEAEDGW